MAFNILVDTNILLDSALQRQPFNIEADNILRASDSSLIKIFVTATSLLDVFYLGSITRRKDLKYSREDAYREALGDVRAFVNTLEVCTVNFSRLREALAMPNIDFEDNVQVACAKAYHLDAIVTRDKKFPGSTIQVLSPTELLKRLTKRGKRK